MNITEEVLRAALKGTVVVLESVRDHIEWSQVEDMDVTWLDVALAAAKEALTEDEGCQNAACSWRL